MASLALTTFEAIKANFSLLSPEIIAELVQEGVIRSVAEGTLTPHVLGSRYTGKCNLRRVYIFGPDDLEEFIVGEETPWEEIPDLVPQHLYAVTGTLAQLDSRIPAKMAEQNGGIKPVILQPSA